MLFFLLILIIIDYASHSLLIYAMGHTDPRIFNKAYRSQVIRYDIQNIFLGYKS